MEKEAIYEEVSPWIKMREADWSELIGDYRPIDYEKGHIFYDQFEECPNVFVIAKGRVAMSLSSPTGGHRIVAILDEGCVIGNQKLFDEMPNSCSAMTLSNSCTVYEIPVEVAKKKVESSTLLIKNMLQQSNRINRMLITQIDYMSFKSSEVRVCFVLYGIFAQFPKEHYSGAEEENRKMLFKFTHQDVADVTGLSRVSVSTVFSKLVRKGIIGKEKGVYFIKNYDLLKQKLIDIK